MFLLFIPILMFGAGAIVVLIAGASRLGNAEVRQAPQAPRPNPPEQIVRNDEFIPRNRPQDRAGQVIEIYQDIRRELQREGRTPQERFRAAVELYDELNTLNPDTVQIPATTIAAGRRYRSHIQGQVLSSLEAYGNVFINRANVDVVQNIYNNQYLPNREIRILNHQFLANAAAANGSNLVQVFCELEREHLTEEIQGLQNIIGRLGQDRPGYWALAHDLAERQATLDLYNRILDPRNPINNIEGFIRERGIAAMEERERLLGIMPRNPQFDAPGFIQLQQNVGTTRGIWEGVNNLRQLLEPGIIRRAANPPPVLL